MITIPKNRLTKIILTSLPEQTRLILLDSNGIIYTDSTYALSNMSFTPQFLNQKHNIPPLSILLNKTNYYHNHTNKNEQFTYIRNLSSIYNSSFQSNLRIVIIQEDNRVWLPFILDSLKKFSFILVLFVGIVSYFLHQYGIFTNALETESSIAINSENQIKNLSMYEPLTELYNRKYYDLLIETYMNESSDTFDLGIISCDVDGLKLLNDAFGHSAGDDLLLKVKKILKTAFAKYPVVRMGGDEFLIILPYFNQNQTLEARQHLILALSHFNKINTQQLLPVSFSLGCASGINKHILHITEEADAQLYANKSQHSRNFRGRLLEICMSTLTKRQKKLQGLFNEISRLCFNLFNFMPQNSTKMNDLKQLITYHAIGELPFNDIESVDIAKIAQTGYRMAMYFPQLSGIANLILNQYEYYDGSGAFSLIGDNIPLECQMFTIARDYIFYKQDHGHSAALSYLENQKHKYSSQLYSTMLKFLI